MPLAKQAAKKEWVFGLVIHAAVFMLSAGNLGVSRRGCDWFAILFALLEWYASGSRIHRFFLAVTICALLFGEHARWLRVILLLVVTVAQRSAGRFGRIRRLLRCGRLCGWFS